MKDRPFIDKSSQPTDQGLQAAMGELYPCYESLMELTGSFEKEWAFTKSSGWTLKVSARKKSLFYLIPLNNGFKISLAIREKEREFFLRDSELQMMHEQLLSSKKYLEGFALQFEIADKNACRLPELFITKLVALRIRTD